MPVTQREYDLMQAQAQIRVMKMVDEWRRQFLRGRMQSILGGQTPPQAGPMPEEPMSSTAQQNEVAY